MNTTNYARQITSMFDLAHAIEAEAHERGFSVTDSEALRLAVSLIRNCTWDELRDALEYVGTGAENIASMMVVPAENEEASK